MIKISVPPEFRAMLLGGGDPTLKDYPLSERLLAEGLALPGLHNPHTVVIPTAKTKVANFQKLVVWLAKFGDQHLIAPELLHRYGQAPTNYNLVANAQGLLIPGGDTEALIDNLGAWGLLDDLDDALVRGVPLVGWSAALAFLFARYFTDADSYKVAEGQPWDYRMTDGTSFINTACSPHGDDDALKYTHNQMYEGSGLTRRDLFVRALEAERHHLNGIVVDNHTAIEVHGDRATVRGTGRVTLHIWQANRLVERTYVDGESFSLSTLES